MRSQSKGRAEGESHSRYNSAGGSSTTADLNEVADTEVDTPACPPIENDKEFLSFLHFIESNSSLKLKENGSGVPVGQASLSTPKKLHASNVDEDHEYCSSLSDISSDSNDVEFQSFLDYLKLPSSVEKNGEKQKATIPPRFAEESVASQAAANAQDVLVRKRHNQALEYEREVDTIRQLVQEEKKEDGYNSKGSQSCCLIKHLDSPSSPAIMAEELGVELGKGKPSNIVNGEITKTGYDPMLEGKIQAGETRWASGHGGEKKYARLGRGNVEGWAEAESALLQRQGQNAAASSCQIVGALHHVGDPGGELPVFSTEDVTRHSSLDSAWLVYKGHVYDVTSYLPKHPGGSLVAFKNGVTLLDATENIDAIHTPAHLLELEKYCIGRLGQPDDSDQANRDNQEQTHDDHMNPNGYYAMRGDDESAAGTPEALQAMANVQKPPTDAARSAANNLAQSVPRTSCPPADNGKPPIAIGWYASEGGYTARLAWVVHRRLKDWGCVGTMNALSECAKLNCLHDLGAPGSTLVVLLTSTAGDGQLPSGARSWFSKLKEMRSGSFQDVPYAIFGIGDSSHQHFNSAAKQIDGCLFRLGARRIACRFGDRQAQGINRLEEEFDNWCKDIKSYLLDAANMIVGEGRLRLPIRTCFRWGIAWEPGPMAEMQRHKFGLTKKVLGCSKLIEATQYATVSNYKVLAPRNDQLNGKAKIELTMKLPQLPASLQDRFQTEYQISTSHLEAKSPRRCNFDIHVHPRNTEENIARFASVLQKDALKTKDVLDVPFCMVPLSGFGDVDLPFDSPTTLRQILCTHVDFVGPPNQLILKRFLDILADERLQSEQRSIPRFRVLNDGSKLELEDGNLVQNSGQGRGYADMLKELHALSLPQNRLLWKSQFSRSNGFSLLTIFEDYDLLREIPLPDLLHAFGDLARIASRPYSISSWKEHEGGILLQVLVSVIHQSRAPAGVCSNYLAGLRQGSLVKATVSPSQAMILPPTYDQPIVMIAAGTGIAPFLAFLEKRDQASTQANLGPAILFFGCKQRDFDFLYQDQLYSLMENGSLSGLYPAFSQAGRGQHIQDVLEANMSQVKMLLDEETNGCVYICGSADMGKSVRDIFSKHIGDEWVEKLSKEHRMKVEIWDGGAAMESENRKTWTLSKKEGKSLQEIAKALKSSSKMLIEKGRFPDVLFHDMLNMTGFQVGVPTESHLKHLAQRADIDGSLSRMLDLLPGPCSRCNSKWIRQKDELRCDPAEIARVAHRVQLEFFQGNELCLTQHWQEQFADQGIASNIVYPRFTVYGCGASIQHKIIARVLIGNHDDNRRIMEQHARKDSLNEIQTFANVANTPDNESWRHQRNVLLCPFQSNILREIIPNTLNRCKHMVERLHARVTTRKQESDYVYDSVSRRAIVPGTVDMNDFFVDESLAHLLEVMLGIPRAEAESLNKTIRFTFAVENYLRDGDRESKTREATLAPAIRKIFESLPRLDGPLARNLKLSDKELSRHGISKKSCSMHVKVGNLMHILHAGHTNIGYSLAFFLLELCRNPEIQDQLVASVQSWWAAIRTKSNACDSEVGVELEDLDPSRIDFLDRYITEILRLWPTVATGSFRELEYDEVVSNGGGGQSCVLPKGTMVNTPIWQRHRDTSLWGEDAHIFRPSRDFQDGEISRMTKAFPKSGRFNPFGVSPRTCPAAQYSGLQMRLIILYLFRDFRFRLASPYKDCVGPGVDIPTCQPDARPELYRGVVRGAMGPLDLERSVPHNWGVQYLAGLRCHVAPLGSTQTPERLQTNNTVAQFACHPSDSLLRNAPNGFGRYNDYIEPETIPQRFLLKSRNSEYRNLVALREIDISHGCQKEWTWSNYEQEVRKVGAALIYLDIGPHTPIAILGDNSPEWYFAAMGIIFAGNIAFGIYTTSAASNIDYVLRHSKAPAIFVGSVVEEKKILQIANRLEHLRFIIRWGGSDFVEKKRYEAGRNRNGCAIIIISWEQFLLCENNFTAKENLSAVLSANIEKQKPGQCCYLSYTSGTTGHPKAVMHSHDSLIWGMGRLLAECNKREKHATAKVEFQTNKNMPEEQRELSFLPCCHVAGTLQIIGPVAQDPKRNTIIYFAAPRLGTPLADHTKFVALLKIARVTSFWGVPRIWEKLRETAMASQSDAKLDIIGLQHCRFATSGSAPTRKSIFDFFGKAGLTLCECYAMTENAMYSHLAVSGTQKKALLHEDAGVRFSSKDNEILVKSRALMMGYLYKPTETEDAFTDDGYFRTGDTGHCDASDGNSLIITGRKKDIIITSGGENIASVPIEENIRSEMDAISHAVLVGDEQKYLIVLLTAKVVGGLSNESKGQGHILAKSARSVDCSCISVSDAQNSALWKKYIDRGIQRVNSTAPSRVAQIKRWVLLDPVETGDFLSSGASPELTLTGKVRRRAVVEKYQKEILTCYTAHPSVTLTASNKTPVVVIGGGFGGLYYAYRKMQCEQRPVHIYEASDRLGGKYMTTFLHDIPAEHGTLRFEWGIQPLLEDLFEELNIPVTEFPPFCGDSSPDLEFLGHLCKILWTLRKDFCNGTGDREGIESIELENITVDEINGLNDLAWVPYKGGFYHPHQLHMDEWLADYNLELKTHLMIVSERINAFLITNDTLLLWLVRWTKVMASNRTIRTCTRGNQSVVDALERKIPAGSIHLNHRLLNVERLSTRNAMHRCIFENGVSVETDRIILAVPPTVVERLGFRKRKEVDIVFRSLRSYCLGRHFVYVANPPWNNANNDIACRGCTLEEYPIIPADFNCRETFVYSKAGEGDKPPVGMLLLYFNSEHVDFWRSMTPDQRLLFVGKKLGIGKATETAGTGKSSVSQLSNSRILTAKVSREPKILHMSSIFWDGQHKMPFAFHYLDRMDPCAAQEIMANVCLDGDLVISALSDAYSNVPGFTEGVMINVEYVLKKEKSKKTEEG